MFDTPPTNSGATPAHIEDIFSDTEKLAARPATTGSPLPPVAPVPPSGQPPLRAAVAHHGSGARVAIIVGVIVIVLGGIGGAYWWFSNTPAPEQPAAPAAEPAPEQPAAPAAEPAPVAVPESVPGPTDSDSDGLTDAEEQQLGTSAQNIDSDSDGLFDRDEVRVYQTDPLNPDSDGDTFTDGTEVQNGYNPKGTGKLLELPQQ